VKLLLLVLLTSSLAGSAAEPPPNTIPVITMKTGQDSTCFEVDVDHLEDNRMSLMLDAPLDAGYYDRFGLAVFVERESGLWLGWETDESVEDSVLVETIDAGWSEVERVDPGGGLPDDTLEVLWLGFRPDGGADMRVRVGRVELTE
jgi:hypothetical protein